MYAILVFSETHHPGVLAKATDGQLSKQSCACPPGFEETRSSRPRIGKPSPMSPLGPCDVRRPVFFLCFVIFGGVGCRRISRSCDDFTRAVSKVRKRDETYHFGPKSKVRLVFRLILQRFLYIRPDWYALCCVARSNTREVSPTSRNRSWNRCYDGENRLGPNDASLTDLFSRETS